MHSPTREGYLLSVRATHPWFHESVLPVPTKVLFAIFLAIWPGSLSFSSDGLGLHLKNMLTNQLQSQTLLKAEKSSTLFPTQSYYSSIIQCPCVLVTFLLVEPNTWLLQCEGEICLLYCFPFVASELQGINIEVEGCDGGNLLSSRQPGSRGEGRKQRPRRSRKQMYSPRSYSMTRPDVCFASLLGISQANQTDKINYLILQWNSVTTIGWAKNEMHGCNPDITLQLFNHWHQNHNWVAQNFI